MSLNSLDRRMLGWSAMFVVSQSNIARLLGPAAPKVFAVQTAWSEQRYRQILASMDETEIARFRSHYLPDFVHPAIYAIALRTGARSLAAKTPLSPAVTTALAVAPVASAAGDYIENIVGLVLVDKREHISDTVVRATTVVSTVKWILAIGSLTYLSQGFLRVWATALLR
ncbi:hypothetical protein HQO38_25030 [Rhodococcus fascians]|nr:hypothetical protein [Rhodococcus fascians]MBY4141310.1 hypothetical protein [Rhodococcus fascians]MBY4219917.1 hypothetical protein [Rhodococcus fascians]MBY4225058.1 hypothetical protein [Rhodococcus fascians]MBY4235181.1 hypothetical protein [Rhodococcus fascians]